MNLTIPYKPRYPDVHRVLENKRFTVIVAHRRFGKTVLALNHMLKQALLLPKPMGRYAFIAPQLKQAKEATWAYLKHFTSVIPGRQANESELSIYLPSNGDGSKIRIFGADNPDALRGAYYDGVVMDEVAQMKPEVWQEVVRPMLADRRGWALFIGTPKGINLFSELYYKALKKEAEGHPDWAALCFPVDKTNALPARDVEDMRQELSDNAFRQEMLCDFTASDDNILISLDEVNQGFDAIVDEEAVCQWPLVVGVDVARFGADSTVFFRRRGRRAYEPLILHNLSNTDVAQRLIAYIAEYKPALVNIDQGQGTGVIDLVQDLTRGHNVVINEVPFGSRANHDDKFVNRRAEMWTKMRDWLRAGGKLPAGHCAGLLKGELTAPTYSFDAAGKIKLEPKEHIKERLRRSTDLADALALTFAIEMGTTIDEMFPLRKYGTEGGQAAREWLAGRRRRKEYHPFK